MSHISIRNLTVSYDGHDALKAGYVVFGRSAMQRIPNDYVPSRAEVVTEVSAALAQQVLDSLYELMRGFQAANEHTKGKLLHNVLASQPDHVYSGLLTVLMRLVFLLYSEDRGLMPGSSIYVQHYSVHGLFERLRSDNERSQILWTTVTVLGHNYSLFSA